MSGFDAASFSSAAGVTSLTWNHTNAGDLAVVGVSFFNTALGVDVSTITYAGAGFTEASTSVKGSGGIGVQMAYLKDPPVGASTVTVTIGGDPADNLIAGMTTWTNSTGIAGYTSSTGNSTRATITVVATSTSDWVVDCVMTVEQPTAAVAGASTNWNTQVGRYGASARKSAASSVSMDMFWTMTGSLAENWAYAALAIASSGGAGAPAATLRKWTVGLMGMGRL